MHSRILCRFEAPLDVTDSVLDKLLFAPLVTVLLTRLCVLIEVLFGSGRFLCHVIELLLPIVEAKVEVMLSQAGSSRVSVDDAFAAIHRNCGLFWPFVDLELIVAAHPYVLHSLFGIIDFPSLLELLGRLANHGLQLCLVGRLEVILAAHVLLLAISKID